MTCMSLRSPSCPSCDSDLSLTSTGELDAWHCPMLHGAAITLTEAHGRLQEDEIGELWAATRQSWGAESVSGGTRSCPICTVAMTSILVSVDADEADDGECADGEDSASVWIDVCEPCQLIWFDRGELEVFPVDVVDAEPSAEEVASIAQVVDGFGAAYAAAVSAREASTFTERAYRFVARNPGLLRALTTVGSLGRE